MDFFENLDLLLRSFWFVAIATSLVFIIQTIMTFVGADAGDGVDADFDSNLDGTEAPFQLFSFRNLVNFLLGFSWTGISLFNVISNPFLLILISVLVGVLFVAMFFFIIKQLQKLSEDNSFKMEKTLNKTADVYLAIPAFKGGKGKITISINGSFRELEAMTEGEKIETGAVVRIARIESGNILMVEKI